MMHVQVIEISIPELSLPHLLYHSLGQPVVILRVGLDLVPNPHLFQHSLVPFYTPFLLRSGHPQEQLQIIPKVRVQVIFLFRVKPQKPLVKMHEAVILWVEGQQKLRQGLEYLLLIQEVRVGQVINIDDPRIQVKKIENEFLAIIIQRPQHYVTLIYTHIDAVQLLIKPPQFKVNSLPTVPQSQVILFLHLGVLIPQEGDTFCVGVVGMWFQEVVQFPCYFSFIGEQLFATKDIIGYCRKFTFSQFRCQDQTPQNQVLELANHHLTLVQEVKVHQGAGQCAGLPQQALLRCLRHEEGAQFLNKKGSTALIFSVMGVWSKMLECSLQTGLVSSPAKAKCCKRVDASSSLKCISLLWSSLMSWPQVPRSSGFSCPGEEELLSICMVLSYMSVEKWKDY